MAASDNQRDDAWGRRRLLVACAGVMAAAVLVVVGLGLTVHFAVASAQPGAAASGTSTSGSEGRAGGGGDRSRDEIAAAPMLQVRPRDSTPAAPAAIPAESIEIPPATTAGPADVPSGFPRTPQGAIGQLAAIETTALQAMSIHQVNEVHAAWTMPGAAAVPEWEMTRNVQAFLGRAGMHDQLDPTAAVRAVPVGAQVKGTDGPGWVLACVLLEVRATLTTTSSMGYGYCERMQWSEQDQRWMVGPGQSPTRAPSTWPGTDLAALAGWRAWAEQGTG